MKKLISLFSILTLALAIGCLNNENPKKDNPGTNTKKEEPKKEEPKPEAKQESYVLQVEATKLVFAGKVYYRGFIVKNIDGEEDKNFKGEGFENAQMILKKGGEAVETVDFKYENNFVAVSNAYEMDKGRSLSKTGISELDLVVKGVADKLSVKTDRDLVVKNSKGELLSKIIIDGNSPQKIELAGLDSFEGEEVFWKLAETDGDFVPVSQGFVRGSFVVVSGGKSYVDLDKSAGDVRTVKNSKGVLLVGHHFPKKEDALEIGDKKLDLVSVVVEVFEVEFK